jgi:V/A-type H+-transporting ATPase subunit D
VAEIKFTKNELRSQQVKLGQLNRYLPTLQLKKAMLQSEVYEARLEIRRCEEEYERVHTFVGGFAALLTDKEAVDFDEAVHVTEINRHYDNIAGVDVPYFDNIQFAPFSYDLFETPAWTDSVIKGLRGLAEASARIEVAKEKKNALEKELREVSIRVNLFEKVLIPRAIKNIKRIKVFLGDQELAAVSQAKVAKAKIEERKREAEAGYAR